MGFWRRIFGLEDNEVEVAKSGDVNYVVIKQKGEVIMAIVQPPSTYSGKTGVGGKISIFDASGNAQVDRAKDITYGEPYILFNPNNKEGLQLQSAVSEAKRILPEALKNAPDIKVNIDKLDEAHATTVEPHSRVSIGNSAVLQISEDASVSVIISPAVTEADREILNAFLIFMIKALVGREQTYRANIMLLDPRDNRLKITAYCNMDGYVDRNIALPPNVGNAGESLQNDQEKIYDPRIMGRMKVDPDKVWLELKSIISMPIHDSQGAILGVLNIDSNKTPDQSKFLDEDFKIAMRLAADAFGRILGENV